MHLGALYARPHDEEWEKRGWFETPNCKKKPSDYIKSGKVYIHVEPGEKLIPEVIREMGSNRLMYASDWPHWDHEYPESVFGIWEREDLTEVQSGASFGITPWSSTDWTPAPNFL